MRHRVFGDGLLDLLLFYKTPELAAAVEPGAALWTLGGSLLNGDTFVGSDTVSLKP